MKSEPAQTAGNAPELFRSKVTEKWALQLTWANWSAICDFVPKPWFVRGTWLGDDGKPLPTDQTNFKAHGDAGLGLIMRTLESEEFLATGGDWIIKGVKGEFYPCKPDIFANSYERVAASSQEAATPVVLCAKCGATPTPLSQVRLCTECWEGTFPKGCAGCGDGMPLRQFNGELWHIYEGETAYGRKCTATAEPAPSPATKETPTYVNLEPIGTSTCRPTDPPVAGKLVASSQGPAREETLQALQHDYEQGTFGPFTSWNATCKALSKAFDAGAKSVVAAPQPHMGNLWLCYHALKGSEWTYVNNSEVGSLSESHTCAYCGNSKSAGHDKDCMIGNALEWVNELAGAAALPSPEENDVNLSGGSGNSGRGISRGIDGPRQNRVGHLESVVAAALPSAQNQESITFGGSLGPKLRLKKAVPVKIERRIYVSWRDGEEWGEGESLGAAMDDFGGSLRETWEMLASNPLGPAMQKVKTLLEEYIEASPPVPSKEPK